MDCCVVLKYKCLSCLHLTVKGNSCFCFLTFFMFLFVVIASVRTDVCRCNLCWKDETTLIIGWAKSIKVSS